MNSWLTVALVSGAVCFSIIVLTYAFLYSKYRTRFLLLWAAAWLCHASRNVAILVNITYGPFQWLLLVEQLLVLGTSSFLLWGSMEYSGWTAGRKFLAPLGLAAAWVPAAVFLAVPAPWFYIPTYFYFAASQIANGTVLLRKSPRSGAGGRMAGWALILWGLHHLDYPFLRPVAWFAPWGFLIGAALGLLSALGIILVYFERVREELAQSENRFRSLFHSHDAPFILLDPDTGRIEDANEAAANFYGYSPGELRSMDISMINTLPPRETARLRRDAFKRRKRHFIFTHRIKNGEERTVEVYSSPVALGRRELLFSIIHDITDKVRAQRDMAASLAEKEILLREIHHRVKNNLQIVSSLLHLQEIRAGDAASRDSLAESRGRIASMALIHEELYRSGNFREINLQHYLGTILPPLAEGCRHRCRVHLTIDAAGASLALEQAVPFGLLVNELATNAVKHAFAGRDAGTLAVTVRQADGMTTLTVSDDGVGMPVDRDPGKPPTLGMELIEALSGQLGGSMAYGTGPGGTSFTLSFPSPGPRGTPGKA
ncbi:MAG: sensor histidine kinase [Thermodesulfobacteriota bacterium]